MTAAAPPAAPVHAAWHGPLAALPIAVIDLETTGLDADADRVIEVALVAGERRVDTLVRPARRDVGGCHGLTDRDLRRAPAFARIAPHVRAALSGRILVGHCVAFDIAFLRAEFARIGTPLPPLPHICTAELADALDLNHERRRLTYACERHGVALAEQHVARSDAQAAGALFRRYAEIAAQRGADLAALTGRASAMTASWTLPPLPDERLVRAPRLTPRRTRSACPLPCA